MWFSVVCSLIDNDTRHHSYQNVVDSRGVAEGVNNSCGLGVHSILATVKRIVVGILATVKRIVVDKSSHNAKPNEICFSP